jgi:hypothetical protein
MSRKKKPPVQREVFSCGSEFAAGKCDVKHRTFLPELD